MERKTKYRLIGILVFAALVVIVLPLFQKNNELMTQQPVAIIKAPPFPDQAQSLTADAVSNRDQQSVPVQQMTSKVSNNSIQLDTEDVITTTHASLVNQVKEVPEISHYNHLIHKEGKNTGNYLKDNHLVNLKNAAWAIQIGSFKYKANALRMVNELRANGYRAFMQGISTHLGENTRVLIGPENKRNDAYDLAMRLENELHIHGIVISYKPLSL